MPNDCDERDELRRQVRHDRQLHRAWLAHPNPQDPDYPEDYMPTTTCPQFPLKAWEHQSHEERFDASMKDSRLVDEAAGFISDADAAALSALVAATYRESGESPALADIAAIGLAYWTALTRAQRHVTRSVQ